MPPPQHARRPCVLRAGGRAFRKYYSKPRETLPNLDLANGSDRQQRSERREACAVVAECLLHYVDVITFIVGFLLSDGRRMGLTMEYLAKISGLGLRRFERAMADLVAAGYVTVHQICELGDDGVYRGRAAIRAVNPKLFDELGLGKWLRHERRKAYAHRKKKQAKASAKNVAKVHIAVAAAAARSSRPERGKHDGALTPVAAFFTEARLRLKNHGPPS